VNCVGVIVFGSRGNNFLSRLIVAVTRPDGWMKDAVPSHSGIIFVYADGHADYAEAFLGKDWAVSLDIRKLKAYAQGKGQWVHGFALVLDPEQAERIRRRADEMRMKWRYSVPQLFRILRHRVLPFWRIASTPRDVCCSEAAARLVQPACDLTQASGRKTVEDVTPVDLFVAAGKLGRPVKPLLTLLDEIEVA
jgi:hypothetical protein